MPIYEYRCDACGHMLDVLQKISDDPLRECPECREAALRRLVSAPTFRLKGGGWYETDFKSDKERKRNLADSGDGKPADTAGAKTSESDGKPAKPETKKESDSGGGKKTGKTGDKGASSAVA
jgi:putative FmdB family regulatory protein